LLTGPVLGHFAAKNSSGRLELLAATFPLTAKPTFTSVVPVLHRHVMLQVNERNMLDIISVTALAGKGLMLVRHLFSILGSHSGDYEEYCLLGYNAV
jgi:hypothetical protein